MTKSILVLVSCEERGNRMSSLLQFYAHECVRQPTRIQWWYFHDSMQFPDQNFQNRTHNLDLTCPYAALRCPGPWSDLSVSHRRGLINLNSAPPGVMGLQIEWTLCPDCVWSFCHRQFLISRNMIYSSDVAETKGEAVFNNTSDHMPPPPPLLLLLLREKCGENYAELKPHKTRTNKLNGF